jgi:antitoxin ParD1/3/4
MSESYNLGERYESYVQSQLASGRFKSASEVLQAALQLMEQRDRDLNTLDSAIRHGLEDIAQRRLHASDAVFDELEARYDQLAQERAGQ